MAKKIYYNDDVAHELPSRIIADVRYKGGLTVRVFDTEDTFFKFLSGITGDPDNKTDIEHVWKYRAGGRLVEQNVIFKGKLHLMDVLTDI